MLFQRPLSTGDASDTTISAGLQNIIWAFGEGDAWTPSKHDNDDCGATQVDFLGDSGVSTSGSSSSSNFVRFNSDVYYTMQWTVTSVANGGSGNSVPVVQINLTLGRPAYGYWMAVGLGLSMTGSDIMMVSLCSNGTIYVVDRQGVGEILPVLDTSSARLLFLSFFLT